MSIVGCHTKYSERTKWFASREWAAKLRWFSSFPITWARYHAEHTLSQMLIVHHINSTRKLGHISRLSNARRKFVSYIDLSSGRNERWARDVPCASVIDASSSRDIRSTVGRRSGRIRDWASAEANSEKGIEPKSVSGNLCSVYVDTQVMKTSTRSEGSKAGSRMGL